MKKLALLCALCAPFIAANVWAETNVKPAPVVPPQNVKPASVALPQKAQLNGLNAQIVLAPDDGLSTRKNWNGAVNEQVTTVSQGSKLSILIAFSDCTQNAKGACDVAVEFFVVSPDGIKKPGGNGVVWSTAPVSIKGVSFLGQSTLTAGFDNSDPIGDYNVLANVTDKVAGKVLHLSQTFKVTK
jgi:hypothetical protein